MFPPDGRGAAGEAGTGSTNPETDLESDLDSSPPSPVASPVPSSPPLPIHVPSSPSFPAQLHPAASSFDTDHTQLHEPDATQGDYDQLTYDELHRLCWYRGFARKNLKKVPNARPSTMDAIEEKRAREQDDAINTADDMPVPKKEPCRADDLHVACSADKGIAKESKH